MDTQVAYILSLGVVKEFRKHGIGKMLLSDNSAAVAHNGWLVGMTEGAAPFHHNALVRQACR